MRGGEISPPGRDERTRAAIIRVTLCPGKLPASPGFAHARSCCPHLGSDSSIPCVTPPEGRPEANC